MNPQHKTLLDILKAGPATKYRKAFSSGYTGSARKVYGVTNPVLRANVKQWLSDNPQLKANEILEVVHSLMAGESHEEKKMAAMVLGLRKDIRPSVSIIDFDLWLGGLQGWAEVDSLCQSLFTAKELLENWGEWEPFLKRLSQDELTEKRRASLVFLVMPVRKSSDHRLHDAAIENVERLKSEKDILITKAISWILRSMIVKNKTRVADYLEANIDSLPKIAIRETRKVLETGKKT